MSKSGMCINPKHRRPGSNISRPNGASMMADSSFPPDLIAAALYGNRATRRLAVRNLRKRYRADQSKK